MEIAPINLHVSFFTSNLEHNTREIVGLKALTITNLAAHTHSAYFWTGGKPGVCKL
jgi:hypothetical protein